MDKLKVLFWSGVAVVGISFVGGLYQAYVDGQEREAIRNIPVDTSGPAIPATE